MKIEHALRMDNVDGHFLAKQQEKIKELDSLGKAVINLGRGNPDQPTFSNIVKEFENFSKKEENFGYPPYGGKDSLKEAIIDFYKKEYGVSLSIDEVTIFSGSLSALTALPMVLANPGDSILIPNPSFFAYATGAKMAGANIIHMDLTAENDYFPDFKELSSGDLNKVKMMFLNYPNNPTGAGATEEFFTDVVEFAEKNDIVVVHDFAYADISFERKAPSFLQAKKAKSVGIEIYTLSKTFNMAGWRIAFAVGNKEVIGLLNRYIRASVGGTFGAIQDAAAFGLKNTVEDRQELQLLYKNRREVALSALPNSVEVSSSSETFFLWLKLPYNWDDVKFVDELLYEEQVALVPGSVFGTKGAGYVRLSLVSNTSEIVEGIRRLAAFIDKKQSV